MSNRTASREYHDDVKLHVTTHVDSTRTFTTVAVELKDTYGLGTAKRHANDPVDFELGKNLALARALKDLARNLELNT